MPSSFDFRTATVETIAAEFANKSAEQLTPLITEMIKLLREPMERIRPMLDQLEQDGIITISPIEPEPQS